MSKKSSALLAAALMASVAASSAALGEPRYKLAPGGGVVRLWNLSPSPDCVARSVAGRVLERNGDGARVRDAKGEEIYVNLPKPYQVEDPKLFAIVSRGVDSFFRPGNNLKLTVKLCGAAGRIVKLDAVAPASSPASASTTDEKASPQSGGTGRIAGRLSFPAEELPAGMKVCAENIESGKIHCTTRQSRPTGPKKGPGYSLDVPAGRYRVYASLPDPGTHRSSFRPGYRAYYSEFVTCGYNATYPSHRPIPVAVEAGRTVKAIDPGDWYNN